MSETLVREIMHKGIIACRPDTSLEEVVRIMADTEVTAIVVTDQARQLVGIISHMDVLPYYGKNLETVQATDVMTREVIHIAPESTVQEAIEAMLQKRIHRLVVTQRSDNGLQPLGVVSTSDIVRDMRGTKWMWYMTADI